MKKRVIPFVLATALLCALCGSLATAVEPNSSKILSYYKVEIAQGSGTGEIEIKYDVTADFKGTVGVESIEIRRSNGTYVTTITGTTSNGLLKSGDVRNSGTYVYEGISGTYYYAIVTISAESELYYDSRIITTDNAKAP